MLICAIDASKAFDKVNRDYLLSFLIGKVDPEIWRILRKYYNNSLAYVQNGCETTEIFKTTIGVKQSGPLSPKLFSIYVEDMIEEIINSKLIASINGVVTGLIMYADDLLLVTESIDNMRSVLKICEQYGVKLEIKFNPMKTQIMWANRKRDEERITLCGDEIEWVNKMKYLGV